MSASKDIWKNRIVGYGMESPDQLLGNELNHRIHPKKQQDALGASLDEIGFVQGVIVNKRTSSEWPEDDRGVETMVDGHLRAQMALSKGQPEIPVVYVDLSPNEEKLVLATLDRIGELAEVDRDQLDLLLRDIETGSDSLQELLSEMAADVGLYVTPEVVEDEVPDPPAVPITKPGDLWILGEHRLLCGDSTKAEDVERLMNGDLAELLVTSPPYNQSIDKFKPSGMHKEGDWVSNVGRLAYSDSLPEPEYQDRQRLSLDVWFKALADGSSVFYNHKNRYRKKRLVSPLEWLPGPFTIRQEIVWLRPGSVTQNARMFLPCDERIYWMYKGTGFYFDDSTEVKTWSSVWKIGLETNKEHAVAFPVELPARCIRACSRAGGIVFEPHLGSGTTIIAAEQLNRRCYAMELEPGYVDVCVNRWEKLTGKKAVLDKPAGKAKRKASAK